MEKPCLGREGANVRMVGDGFESARSSGTYGGGNRVSQRTAPLLSSEGWTTVIGSWVADGRPAGIVFREAQGAIVKDVARVVPHFFA